jgi:hypothetical protein
MSGRQQQQIRSQPYDGELQRLARFENKNILFHFEKRGSLLCSTLAL